MKASILIALTFMAMSAATASAENVALNEGANRATTQGVPLESPPAEKPRQTAGTLDGHNLKQLPGADAKPRPGAAKGALQEQPAPGAEAQNPQNVAAKPRAPARGEVNVPADDTNGDGAD